MVLNLNKFTYNNRVIITPQSPGQVKATLARRYGAENVEKFTGLYKEANPNTKGLPKWEPYNAEQGATMIFDNSSKIVNNHDKN
ncbi:MAG: hypothetical protein ACM3VS_01070 [Candidatus Dadabacteria bacterium]